MGESDGGDATGDAFGVHAARGRAVAEDGRVEGRAKGRAVASKEGRAFASKEDETR